MLDIILRFSSHHAFPHMWFSTSHAHIHAHSSPHATSASSETPRLPRLIAREIVVRPARHGLDVRWEIEEGRDRKEGEGEEEDGVCNSARIVSTKAPAQSRDI